ncbi:MAG TPA: hypothetical protein VLH08_06980 [Acidobacteriota bacterium]|nr:hypothetical protein [Acidobacteriota bacterium]
MHVFSNLLADVKKYQESIRMHMNVSKTATIHNIFNTRKPDPKRVWTSFQDSNNVYYYYCSYTSELNNRRNRNTREITPGGNNGIFDFEAILF